MPAGNSEPSAAPASALALQAIEVGSPLPHSAMAAVSVAAPVAGLTAKRSRYVDWGTHNVVPSGEYNGPSGPTVESVGLVDGVFSAVCWTICLVCRLMIVRKPENSFQPSAATSVPLGLSVLATRRAFLSRIRVPSGEIHWWSAAGSRR